MEYSFTLCENCHHDWFNKELNGQTKQERIDGTSRQIYKLWEGSESGRFTSKTQSMLVIGYGEEVTSQVAEHRFI